MRLLGVLLAVSACKPVVDADHAAELDAWHQSRIADLTQEDGWLSLAGLHWLDEGDNTVGSQAASDVRLPPRAAERVGVMRRQGRAVSFTGVADVEVRAGNQEFHEGTLRSDHDGDPTILVHRRLRFYVIERGDRLGVRVKDPEAEARARFRGIERYRADPRWRVDAVFDAYEPPRTVEITNVLGNVEEYPCPGAAVFERDGQSHRLDAVRYEGAADLFFVFADETNRDETYGAGRFLVAALPAGGRVLLDFNRAYNPPCAFTPYATCPLPSKSNRLALRVMAGEKRYAGHH